MRVVLDTNVLVAAFAARGQCSELFEHCIREHTLITSAFILGEFENAISNKLRTPPRDVAEALTLLRERMQIVAPSPLESPVCRDPDDDWVLATAISGRCPCLVTGDEDLLALQRHRGIEIIRPAEFWRYEASQRGSS